MSGFKLGARSRSELTGVHPDLVRCVEKAIATTPQDFSVHDGIRSPAEQERLVARGASKTMNSRHLTQPDGYGHAVDLVPYVNGQLRWEWPLIYPIAAAMHAAADEVGVRLRWGGVWDRMLDELPGTADGLKQAVQEYAVRHPGPDFLDGPHFEIHPA
ncbi:M15 family metallopeptidase [Henriciella aquimarina]|uniref:M15 family metallopeptidase n=1 Tax=Henriciella aquimarina TaxID=545261 RepID=UPI000A053AD7|nr:M15 family metallopeptidase [Henriciella aquimarina]